MTLGERQVIVERVGDRHSGRAPGLLNKPRARIAVFLRRQNGVICRQSGHFDRDPGAGRAIAVMFAQVQDHFAQ